MVNPEAILMAAVSAAAYSIVFYAKTKAADPDESFNRYKFGATILVGVGIGTSYQLAGVDFSQETIATQLTAYMGTIAIVESILKTAWRKYLRKLLSQG